MRNIGSNVKRAPNQEPIAVASAKNHACRENCGIPVKKGGQVTPHRQTRAEASDNASDHRLYDTDSAARHTQFYVVGPQRRGETAAEHAEDHHAVDTRQRRTFQMNQLVVAPLFGMNAKKLQNLPAPAGKFARHGPERAGDAKIVGRENTGCDHRRGRRPEFN
ncbi:hypothetical protein SEEPB585_22045 [Salmonella enterica subsp. enterica serovar Paratyphi B str. ATCC BAA-1585]|nr:hypothetical protein SEEPB585_22045 [Salmonella enterica subsp. enterica serovar Paratyphi B str. ATCC BAA-1585]